MVGKQKNKDRYSLASILVSQGEYKFHIVSMPSDIIKDTCFTITREDDPIEGFQRRLDEKRANEIAKYIDADKGSIPTAIILSAQDEADLQRNIKNKTLSFKKNSKAFLIIDGQHRVWGFSKSEKSIRVPVIIYVGLTRVQEAQLFIDINVNQKEVPKELILDVKALLEKETEEEKVYNEIFNLFIKQQDSVIKDKINVGEKKKGNLSRVVFNKAIENIVSGKLKELNNDKKYEIINNYLYAFNKCFLEISDEFEGTIVKPIVFRGIMNIANFVIDKTMDKYSNLKKESFYNTIKVIKSNISYKKINKPGASYKNFSDILLQGLTKSYIPATIITE